MRKKDGNKFELLVEKYLFFFGKNKILPWDVINSF